MMTGDPIITRVLIRCRAEEPKDEPWPTAEQDRPQSELLQAILDSLRDEMRAGRATEIPQEKVPGLVDFVVDKIEAERPDPFALTQMIAEHYGLTYQEANFAMRMQMATSIDFMERNRKAKEEKD